MDLERSILLVKLELRPLDPFSWCGECGEGGVVEGEREEPDALGRRIGTLRLDERCFDDSVEEITKVHTLYMYMYKNYYIIVINIGP